MTAEMFHALLQPQWTVDQRMAFILNSLLNEKCCEMRAAGLDVDRVVVTKISTAMVYAEREHMASLVFFPSPPHRGVS